MKLTHTLTLPLLAALIVSCGRETTTKVRIDEPAESSLTSVFVPSISDEAQAIHVARQSAKPGDTIVLKGQVMGASEPFVDGRAAFILGDREKLTPCNERPGDSCKTPWDNCCDTKEAFQSGTATIQVIGDDGRVLKQGIEGVQQLQKLSKLLVRGEVAETSTAGNLVINATAIQIVD